MRPKDDFVSLLIKNGIRKDHRKSQSSQRRILYKSRAEASQGSQQLDKHDDLTRQADTARQADTTRQAQKEDNPKSPLDKISYRDRQTVTTGQADLTRQAQKAI